MTETCAAPGCPIPRPSAPATGGARPKYCSEACRKRAYRLRAKPATPAGQAAQQQHGPGSGPAPSWEPATPPRPAPPREEDPGACPECGTVMVLTPRGTQAGCGTCSVLRIPPKALRAHTVQAGERQVVSRAERDETGRDLFGTVQELLDGIAAEIQAGELTPYARGRLDWYAEELKEAKKARNGARVDQLAADLAVEDLGVTTDGSGDVLDGEVVYDSAEDVEVTPERYAAVIDAMWRSLSPGPRLGIGAAQAQSATPDQRNPAQRFRDSRRQPPPDEPGPQVRHLPRASASRAATPMQTIPAHSAPDSDGEVIAAMAEAGATGAQLVAYALRRDPARPYVAPAGAQVTVPRRTKLPWRRRAIPS